MSKEKKKPQTYDPSKAVASIHIGHEGIMDMILANPACTLKELSAATKYSVPWLYRLLASDLFQARLRERHKEMVDPMLAASLNERLKAVGFLSCDVLMDKLADPNVSASVALRGVEMAARLNAPGTRAPRVPEGHIPMFTINLTQQVAASGHPALGPIPSPDALTVVPVVATPPIVLSDLVPVEVEKAK